MSVPILKTKIHLPHPRADLVARPHLIEKLKSGLTRKLTLISAPAGFGKTTLLSDFIAQAAIPFGWISLDEDDNAPSRFLSYLVAALQTIKPELGQTLLPALQSPQPPPPISILPFLTNEIVDTQKIGLVLDDYHLIKSHKVHEITQYLIQHMPTNLHLMIATRTTPPLPLPRLRGRQQLTELHTADLRFSDQEAGAFFNQLRDLCLSDQHINALNVRAEGWITGLQLAVFSLTSQDDIDRFIESFTGSNRFIIDYLLEEVLERQPPTTRKFLLQTSILSRLCGGLCTAVTGERGSQQILEEIERANLFLSPLDDLREWFRYHHLFAELLQHRLQLTAPELIPKLHLRASRWHNENGIIGQAIEHSLAAFDYDQAILLLERYDQSMWEYGDQSRLTKWLSKLPEEIKHKHPTLLAHQAFALCFSGEFDAAEELLSTAEKNVDPGNNLFQGMAAITRAFRALYNNQIDTAASFAESALHQLPGEEHLLLSLALSIHGDVTAYYGHVPTSEKIWTQSLQEAEKAGSLFFSFLAGAKLVVAQKRLGKLNLASQTFQDQIEQAAKSQHTDMAIAGALYTVYGDILLEWNRIEEALNYIQRGLVLSEQQHYAAGIAWSSLSYIQALFSQMDIQGAIEALVLLEERIRKQSLPTWTSNWVHAWKIRLLIANGDLKSAAKVIHSIQITLSGKFAYPNEIEYLAYARLLIANGEFSDAQELLTRLLVHLQSNEWIDKIIEVQVLRSLILQKQNETGQALKLLAAVLELAQPEGYRRVFLNEGKPMANLLYQGLENGLHPEYVGQLLAAFPETNASPTSPAPQPKLIEPLSNRELDVLRLVAQGATNQETAQSLQIALGTVKNHLKSIYTKLNVHSRTQAAARARDLNLLP